MRKRHIVQVSHGVFALLSTLATFLPVGATTLPTVIDEDTVVVGGLSESLEARSLTLLSRRKREAYTTINGQQVLISCSTARNIDGACRPFGECYPLFKLRDAQIDERFEGLEDDSKDSESKVRDELKHIYKGVSGPCNEFVLNAIANALGTPIPKQNYVCCPTANNFTKVNQLSRPPAPAEPTYARQHCGRFFVDKAAENDTESDTATGRGSENGKEPKIVGGREARRGEFPWSVALMLNNKVFCGGSLISSQHILTAAHCVQFMNRNDVNRLRVQIGDHNVYSTQDGSHEVRGASNVYYHRQFTMRSLYHDVAVIRLSQAVGFTKFIQPICLSTNTWGLENSVASVAGWGQLSVNGFQSHVLRTVGVKIWNQNECFKTYKGVAGAPSITNGMICAGGRGYDSCQGDSGGPLSIARSGRAEQIGIVSWGIGCASYPGVYTRVDQYLEWINKNRR